METTEKIIDLYNRGCETEYITEALSLPLVTVANVLATHIQEKVRLMWLETDLSQALIAARCGIAPSYVYSIVKDSFTVEQRIAKKSKLQRKVQTDERVSPPSWYTGPGRAVPLKVLEYCEAMGVTEIPPGMSVVLLSEGVFALMTKGEAKRVSEARNIILGAHSENQPTA